MLSTDIEGGYLDGNAIEKIYLGTDQVWPVGEATPSRCTVNPIDGSTWCISEFTYDANTPSTVIAGLQSEFGADAVALDWEELEAEYAATGNLDILHELPYVSIEGTPRPGGGVTRSGAWDTGGRNYYALEEGQIHNPGFASYDNIGPGEGPTGGTLMDLGSWYGARYYYARTPAPLFQRNLFGNRYYYSRPSRTEDEFFGTPEGTTNNVIRYSHVHASGVNFTSLEMEPIPMTSPAVDVMFNHFNLSGDRVDSIMRIYGPGDTYLGKFVYDKVSSTWSRTVSATDIQFYDSNDNLLVDISALDFAGTSYGNGRLGGTWDFSNPNQIVFNPYVTTTTTHSSSVVRTYGVTHGFGAIEYVTHQLVSGINTYSGSGECYLQIGNEFSLYAAR